RRFRQSRRAPGLPPGSHDRGRHQRGPPSASHGLGRSRRPPVVHAPAVPVSRRRRAYVQRRGHGRPGSLLTEHLMERIEFYRHDLGDAEITSITETIRSLFLTLGPRVAVFEQAFGEFLGERHVVGVSSCTMGLVLALDALGIGPADEVITTPMTFISTP